MTLPVADLDAEITPIFPAIWRVGSLPSAPAKSLPVVAALLGCWHLVGGARSFCAEGCGLDGEQVADGPATALTISCRSPRWVLSRALAVAGGSHARGASIASRSVDRAQQLHHRMRRTEPGGAARPSGELRAGRTGVRCTAVPVAVAEDLIDVGSARRRDPVPRGARQPAAAGCDAALVQAKGGWRRHGSVYIWSAEYAWYAVSGFRQASPSCDHG